MKILALQFRYLGDAVLMTPALRLLRRHFPEAELHVVVAAEVTPLLEHLPWLDHVWPYPRRRGRKAIAEAWPVIRELRRQRFDRCVDLGGNDRGAVLSLLCGAPERLGPRLTGGFLGRNYCYTRAVELRTGEHEVLRDLRILSGWGITTDEPPPLEIRADPGRSGVAESIMPRPAIICHLSTSQPKKDWPLQHWIDLWRRIIARGHEAVFTSGIAPRELALLEELKRLVPDACVLPAMPDLATFLAVLARASVFISGDTGPLHFAAALGVPTISVFGPSFAARWAPLDSRCRALQVEDCDCRREILAVCSRPIPCLAGILPETVAELVEELIGERARAEHADAPMAS
jgi:heptosyltransferase-3